MSRLAKLYLRATCKSAIVSSEGDEASGESFSGYVRSLSVHYLRAMCISSSRWSFSIATAIWMLGEAGDRAGARLQAQARPGMPPRPQTEEVACRHGSAPAPWYPIRPLAYESLKWSHNRNRFTSHVDTVKASMWQGKDDIHNIIM